MTNWARALAILESGSVDIEGLDDEELEDTLNWLTSVSLDLLVRATFLDDGTSRERVRQGLDQLSKFETLCRLFLRAIAMAKAARMVTRTTEGNWQSHLATVNAALELVASTTRPIYNRWSEARGEVRGYPGQAGNASPPGNVAQPPINAGHDHQGSLRSEAYAVKACRVRDENQFDHLTGPRQEPPYHAAALLSRVNQMMNHADGLPYVKVKLTDPERADQVLLHLSPNSLQYYGKMWETLKDMPLAQPIHRHGRMFTRVTELVNIWDHGVSENYPILRMEPRDCRSFPELFVLLFPAGLSPHEVRRRYDDAVTKYLSDGSTPPDQVFSELTHLASATNNTHQTSLRVPITEVGQALREYIALHRSHFVLTQIEMQHSQQESQGPPGPDTIYYQLQRFVSIAKGVWSSYDVASSAHDAVQARQRANKMQAPRKPFIAVSEQVHRPDPIQQQAIRRHQGINGIHGARLAQAEVEHDSEFTSQLNAVEFDDEFAEGVDLLAFIERDAIEEDNLWVTEQDLQAQLFMTYDDINKINVTSARDMQQKLCFRCHQPGHIARECKNRNISSFGNSAAKYAHIFRRDKSGKGFEPAHKLAGKHAPRKDDGALFVLARTSPPAAYRVD